jgi:hypothetical protein
LPPLPPHPLDDAAGTRQALDGLIALAQGFDVRQIRLLASRLSQLLLDLEDQLVDLRRRQPLELPVSYQ